MNSLLNETRSQRIDLGLPMLSQLRVSPTIHALLADAKPDHQSWPDFAIEAMVIRVLLPHTLALRLRELNRQCVRIVGAEPEAAAASSGPAPEAGASAPAPDRRQVAPEDPTAVRRSLRAAVSTALAAGKGLR